MYCENNNNFPINFTLSLFIVFVGFPQAIKLTNYTLLHLDVFLHASELRSSTDKQLNI